MRKISAAYNYERKQCMLKECDRRTQNGIRWTLSKVVSWTKEHFNLKVEPSKMTRPRILKHNSDINSKVLHNRRISIRIKKVTCSSAENQLAEWV